MSRPAHMPDDSNHRSEPMGPWPPFFAGPSRVLQQREVTAPGRACLAGWRLPVMPSAGFYNSLHASPLVKGSTYSAKGYQPIKPTIHQHRLLVEALFFWSASYPATLGRHFIAKTKRHNSPAKSLRRAANPWANSLKGRTLCHNRPELLFPFVSATHV